MRQHKFYTTSDSAWSSMIQAIKQSERTIYFESFIFEDDHDPGQDFVDAILDRAESGVKVKIVFDGLGSLWLSGNSVGKLRIAGAEVLFFNGWLRRIHRKILVIDEEVAFFGGVNVGKKHRRWLDLHLKLTNKRIVRSLVNSFARSYFYCGGRDPELLKLRKKKKVRRTGLWLLENYPWLGEFVLRPYYEEKILQAKESIVFVTPYFIPHRWLLRSLQLARARGVTVEGIVPETADVLFVNFATHVFISSLRKTGIKFYLTKEMIHAKAILIDNKIGLVGSNNIDARSFDLNAEVSLSFDKKEMLGDLRTITEIWKKDAVLFQYDANSERWYHKFFEWLVKFLQPVL